MLKGLSCLISCIMMLAMMSSSAWAEPSAPAECAGLNPEKALELSAKSPEKIFEKSKCYAALPDARNIFMSAAKANPVAAFNNIEMFVDREWALDTVNVAAMESPESAFRCYKKFREKVSDDKVQKTVREVLRKIMKEAAIEAVRKEDYWTVLAFADTFIGEDWAKDILVESGKKDFRSFISYRKGQGADWFKKLLKDVVFGAIEESPAVVLENADSFEEEAWAKDAVFAAAERDPESAFKYFRNFSRREWSRSVLEKNALAAVEKNPMVIMENAPVYAIKDSDSWFWKVFPERDVRKYRKILRKWIEENDLKDVREPDRKEGGVREFTAEQQRTMDIKEVDFLYMKDIFEDNLTEEGFKLLDTSSKNFFQNLFNFDPETGDVRLIFKLDALRGVARTEKMETVSAITDLWVASRSPQAIRDIIRLRDYSDEKILAVIKNWSSQLIYEAISNFGGKIPESSFRLIFDGYTYFGGERKYALMPKVLDKYKNKGREGAVLQFFEDADPKGKYVNRFLGACSDSGKLGDLLELISSRDDRMKLMSYKLSKNVKRDLLKKMSAEDRQALLDGTNDADAKQRLRMLIRDL